MNDRITKRFYVGKCAGSSSVVGRGRNGRYREGMFKEKRFGCQASKENGA